MPVALIVLVLAAGWRIAAIHFPALANVTPLMALVLCGAVYFPARRLWLAPLAALVLERAPAAVAWACVAAFVFANLRLGAQLPFIPASRASLALSLALAVGCLYSVRRSSAMVAAS